MLTKERLQCRMWTPGEGDDDKVEWGWAGTWWGQWMVGLKEVEGNS